MTPNWDLVTEARIPDADLACLAALRARPDILVRLRDGLAWVSWTSSQADAVRALLPPPGIEFFQNVNGARHRFGSRLPTTQAPPNIDARPLASVLFPSAPHPIPPGETRSGESVLRLVRSEAFRPTSALVCELTALRTLADSATTAELASIAGLFSGERVVLFGEKLPVVRGAVRFHGRDLLIPIGFRLDPDLPQAVVRTAAGVSAREVVLITESRYEAIPRDRAEPLTRAGLRIAIAGAIP